MLIDFTVANFLSFQKTVTLSLEAAPIVSEDKSVDVNNLIPLNERVKLLTSAVIYGANASGKSNFIKALLFMKSLVVDSARESQADDPIPVEPFRLNSRSKNSPSSFEIICMIDQQKYRYGFEVTREKIEREWLYFTPTSREAKLFTREGNHISHSSRMFREGGGLAARTRPNALFLSVAAQFNGPIAQKMMGWFRNIRFISGLNDLGYREFTLTQFQKNSLEKERILNLVRALDVAIEEIEVETVDPEKMPLSKDLPDEIRKWIASATPSLFSARSKHTEYDDSGHPMGQVEFDLEASESEGTQKLFYLSGPILDVLSSGKTLVVDEMEARMHPLITSAIIRLFNSLETNPKRAQIIFTTHDTNLLDRALFRRDQIWFTEKDSYGSSHLYSLVEFKPRNDESFERNYLRGKYGAVPYLGDFQKLIVQEE